MDLEEIKQKIAIIFNTKDIENIEDILSYDDIRHTAFGQRAA